MVAMADEWRIREFLNQNLLFFALQVHDRVIQRKQPTAKLPAPLPPFGRIEKSLQDRLKTIDESLNAPSPSIKGLRAVTTDTLDRVARLTASNIGSLPPWTIGDVVEWWIATGIAVAPWKADMLQRFRRRGATPPGHQAGPLLDEWLWPATLRRLQLEDDEEHPPLWCAAHIDAWRISGPPLAADRPDSWNLEATHPDECRLALLEWCGNPQRELREIVVSETPTRADDWASDYRHRYHDFARSALRLLRRRCHFAAGSRTGSDASGGWIRAATAQSPSRETILRPPMIVATEDAVEQTLPGWFVRPWPTAIISQLRNVAPSVKPRFGSITRALEAASKAFFQCQSFAALPPWSVGPPAAGSTSVVEGLEQLAAIMRLGVIEETLPPREDPAAGNKGGNNNSPSISSALRAEGFLWHHSPADATGTRRIPIAAGNVHPNGKERSAVTITRIDSERTVAAGAVGPPARCPDELLAAIEELDWRWWAVGQIRSEDDPAGVATRLTEIAHETDWEDLKCRLLDLDIQLSDAATQLAEAFTRLDTHVMTEMAAVGGESGKPLRSFLEDHVRNVARTVFQLLVEKDADHQGGLYPPRSPKGRINLATWADERHRSDPRATQWQVQWERSPEAFGAQVGTPRRENSRFLVMFSAGEAATPSELRMLNAMSLTAPARPPFDAFWILLRKRAAAGITQRHPPDFSAVIKEMQQSWSGEAADTFNDVITAAVGGDQQAMDTVLLLRDEARFEFVCHPTLDISATEISLRAAAAGDALEWQDDETTPVDQDIEVVYAFDPHRARRVISRGHPPHQSPEALAARFADIVPAESPSSIRANELRRAIDQRRLFGDAASDPLIAIAAAANALAASDSKEPWVAAAFEELCACCDVLGGRIFPADWHPLDGASAETIFNEGIEITKFGFHPAVPLGRVVVQRFRVTNKDETTVDGDLDVLKSAGPAPLGYRQVCEQARRLTNDHESTKALRGNAFDMPKRVVRGDSPNTIIRELFVSAWKARQAAAGGTDADAAVEAVHLLIEKGYDMVLFKPERVGDFDKNWLETTDGKPPDGSRVNVVRPGVRTRENKLVCPAIVNPE